MLSGTTGSSSSFWIPGREILPLGWEANGTGQEDRTGVAPRADARAVPRAAREGHGASVHRRISRRKGARRVPLRGLWGRSLRLGHQVRLRDGLAELFPARERGRG